jgi:uncharacterized OsmC-like protein
MINIELRDNNRIVTLSSPMKTPIQSRNGSSYFYNSMELVCIAVGSCFGKELVQYCAEEKINPRVFESIKVTMENFTPRIILSHPSDMQQGILDNISLIARNCPVAKLLRNGVEIEFIENQTSTADLVDESKNTSCCGGGHAKRL